MKFSEIEALAIIAMIEGERDVAKMLRGLRRPTTAEKKRDEFYDVIIRKVKLLSV